MGQFASNTSGDSESPISRHLAQAREARSPTRGTGHPAAGTRTQTALLETVAQNRRRNGIEVATGRLPDLDRATIADCAPNRRVAEAT